MRRRPTSSAISTPPRRSVTRCWSGADYYRYNFRGFNLAPLEPRDAHACSGQPNSRPPPPGLIPFNATEQFADNVGVYMQDQIKLPYGFNVLGGARWQYINNRTGASDTTNFCGPFSSNWNPQASHSSSTPEYRSPATSTRSPRGASSSTRGSRRASGSCGGRSNGSASTGTTPSPTAPITTANWSTARTSRRRRALGQQEEAGVKLSLFDDRLQITADYYHLVKTNIPVGIPNAFNSRAAHRRRAFAGPGTRHSGRAAARLERQPRLRQHRRDHDEVDPEQPLCSAARARRSPSFRAMSRRCPRPTSSRTAS